MVARHGGRSLPADGKRLPPEWHTSTSKPSKHGPFSQLAQIMLNRRSDRAEELP